MHLLRITLLAIFIVGGYTDRTDMILQFINKLNKPTKVNAMLCWPLNEVKKISKNLNNLGISINLNYRDNVTIFYPKEYQLYLLDFDCPFANNILQKAKAIQLFDFPFRWIILNHMDLDPLYPIYTNSRVYLVLDDKIVSKYKVNALSNFITNDVARWNGESFDYFNYISDCRNRSNLFGVPMNISIVHMYKSTLNHLDDMREREVDAITKHNYLLVKHIVEYLNVSASYIFHPSWGIPDPKTAIFNGEIGDLQREISEIGGTAAFITRPRIEILDYVGATTPTRAKFIFRAPPLSAVTNVFTLPFSSSVWYSAFILLVFIFIVLYIITKWEWITMKDFLIQEHAALKPTAMDVIQLEIGAICQQGAEAEPKSGAGRIATIFVFLTLMFLYTSYSANIVVLLQSTTDSINTLDDLLKSRIRLGVEETPYSRYYFQIQTGEVQTAIRNTKVSPPNKPDNFMNLLDGVKLMREEFFAFHAECDTIYKVVRSTFLESEKCGLKEIEYWSATEPWIPIRKNSTFKEVIKIGYQKMMERGIQSRAFLRIYSKKPTCQNQGANFISVSLLDCYFPVLAFGIGISIAIFIFIVELLVAKLTKKKN